MREGDRPGTQKWGEKLIWRSPIKFTRKKDQMEVDLIWDAAILLSWNFSRQRKKVKQTKNSRDNVLLASKVHGTSSHSCKVTSGSECIQSGQGRIECFLFTSPWSLTRLLSVTESTRAVSCGAWQRLLRATGQIKWGRWVGGVGGGALVSTSRLFHLLYDHYCGYVFHQSISVMLQFLPGLR